MKAIIILGILALVSTSFAQQTETQDNSAMKNNPDAYSQTIDRSPNSVDPGSGSDSVPADDEGQKLKQPTQSQNMPVDQD